MKQWCAAVILCASSLWGSERITYWVQPCQPTVTGCQTGDEAFAQWALNAWATSSNGSLRFERSERSDLAQIRVLWDNGRAGLYGEARPFPFGSKMGTELHIRPDVSQLGAEIASAAEHDSLLRDAIIYLTCLHESGHALGLPHTDDFGSIMYSFQYGGNIIEYFQRFRRTLKSREDVRRHSGLSEADRRNIAKRYAAN